MNIIIADSWLREFLKTKATPSQIAQYLSLCGPSVERLEKVKKDTLYHIEVTSNRADAFSVFGIAREAAAILPRFGIRAKLVEPKGLNSDLIRDTIQSLSLKVRISKNSLCPRFSAVILSNVSINPSPKLVSDRLLKVGVRPINNVVDVSNYLMYELGQPMHTFDYDQIRGGNINLRESREGEKLQTLDDIHRKLPKGAIVLEDQNRLIDLCGIMGGKNSEVSKSTKNVLLFVQTYDPFKIRKTSQLIKLRTEASQRFEKGLDPDGVITALKRAVYLLKQNTKCNIGSELTDIYKPLPPKLVSLTLDKLTKMIGIRIPAHEVINILKSLDFKTSHKDSQKITFIVPSFRRDDIETEEDLIEEIARIYGYFRLEGELPKGEPPKLIDNPIFKVESQIKNLLKHLGFYEVYTYSQISKQELISFGLKPQDSIRILNPLSSDLEYLRPSLLPSLASIIAKNQAFKPQLSMFEIANIYFAKNKGLPQEKEVLTLVQMPADYFQTKGVIEAMFAELSIAKIKFRGMNHQFFQNYTTIWHNNDVRIGSIGQLSNNLPVLSNLATPITFAEIEIASIVKFANLTKPFKPLSKYPQSTRDIAIIVSQAITIADIENAFQRNRMADLQRLEVFDIFEDPKFGKDAKSVTIRLVFGSSTHTLTQAEVNGLRQTAVNLLIKEFGARVRSITN